MFVGRKAALIERFATISASWNQMTNPYESSHGPLTTVSRHHFVRRYAIAGLTCALLCFIVAIPAAILLNQTYQWIPTSTFLSSMEVNGQTIDNETVLAHSTAYSLVLLGLSIVLVGIAIRNHRVNTKLADNP